tara:strand:- start:4740 stop:6941 length:2202 start_codon:yes stop_codon:yes gene_type:complete
MRIWVYLVLMTFGFAGLGLKEAEPDLTLPTSEEKEGLENNVLVVRVTTPDMRNGERLRSLRKLLQEADREEVSAVILEVDIEAGYSAELANFLLRDLPKVSVPIYTYAKSSALGMGALLALGSNGIYMSPVSVIGGATPDVAQITGKDQEMSSQDRQKVSVLKAQARSLAKAKGHQADLAEAMIDPDFELGPEDDRISKKGEVLTLAAEEAVALNFSKGIVETSAEIVKKEGLKGELIEISVMEWQRSGFRDKLSASKSKKKPGDGPEKVEEEPFLFGKASEASYAGKILIVKVGLRDLSTEARFKFMERIVVKARDDRAAALIFDMHTPGGVGWYTTDVMMGALQEVDFPTFTFVNTKAKSAGALLAIATDHIYMKPTSTIGAALPVMSTGGDIPETMMAKVQADMESTVRNVAIAKGHDPDLCVAFITTETEVIRDGVTICAKGEVLDLNALEAVEVYNGEPLLAKGIVNSIDEIIEQEGLEGEVLDVKATPLEAFAQWTQAFSFLLIAFGVGGAYLELNSPGFGIPGIVSVLSFTLFFFGNNVAGNMAGYETAFFFILGLALLALELLILGGSTVIIGVVGALLMVGSLGFALVDRVDLGDFMEGGEAAPTLGSIARVPIFTMMISIFLAAVLIGVLMKFLPHLTPATRLVLQESLASGTAIGDHEIDQATGKSPLLGKAGVAKTDLRPSGKAVIDGKLLDVTSDSEFIEEGSAIKVGAVYGDRIVVDRA